MEIIRKLELLEKSSEALKRHESPFNWRFHEKHSITPAEVGELCEAVAEAIDKDLPK